MSHANQGPGVSQRSLYGGDDADTGKPYRKRYEVAIPTLGLKWDNLQTYLELEFSGLKFPKDQKTVTILNENYVVVLPAKLTPEQQQDIYLLRGNQKDATEFLQGLKESKLQTVSEGAENDY